MKLDGKELDEKPIRIQYGSKNKKHISNKMKLQRKARMQKIAENKLKLKNL